MLFVTADLENFHANIKKREKENLPQRIKISYYDKTSQKEL